MRERETEEGGCTCAGSVQWDLGSVGNGEPCCYCCCSDFVLRFTFFFFFCRKK